MLSLNFCKSTQCHSTIVRKKNQYSLQLSHNIDVYYYIKIVSFSIKIYYGNDFKSLEMNSFLTTESRLISD